MLKNHSYIVTTDSEGLQRHSRSSQSSSRAEKEVGAVMSQSSEALTMSSLCEQMKAEIEHLRRELASKDAIIAAKDQLLAQSGITFSSGDHLTSPGAGAASTGRKSSKVLSHAAPNAGKRAPPQPDAAAALWQRKQRGGEIEPPLE